MKRNEVPTFLTNPIEAAELVAELSEHAERIASEQNGRVTTARVAKILHWAQEIERRHGTSHPTYTPEPEHLRAEYELR